MKKLFLIFILIFFSQTAIADMMLYGEAEYNANNALQVVQKNKKTKINFDLIKPYLIDINREENLQALLMGKINFKDRELALFSAGTYGVVYKNDKFHAYYYSSLGNLEYIDIRSDDKYPYKSYQYNVLGELVNMGLRLSKREAYIYSPEGKLIAHWLGENGYDENGKIIMRRKFIE